MKIAIAQYRPSESIDTNLETVINLVNKASKKDVSLIFFNQFFLGFIDSIYNQKVVTTLSKAATLHNIEIVTGNLVVNELNNEISSAFFDRKGNLSSFDPEITATSMQDARSRLFNTELGTLMVLSELEAYDSEIDSIIHEIKPEIILMQVSAISLLEQQAIKELALERSLNQAHLVLTASMIGEFNNRQFLGNSITVMQGEITAEASASDSELLITDIDPERFIDYNELREPVIIPELLKQKLVHDSTVRESSKKMES